MRTRTRFITVALFFLTVNILQAQTVENLQESIYELCSWKIAGGSRDGYGATPTTNFVERKMAECSLKAFGQNYRQYFTSDGIKGVNVIGMLEGYRTVANYNYVIVGTHFNNIGIIDRKLYPCADYNASGMAAMLEIARMFRQQRENGTMYNTNIIFVVFDRFPEGRLGSTYLWNLIANYGLLDPISHFSIPADRIKAMIYIDQIGCTLAPVHKDREDYIIALGEKSLPIYRQGVLSQCNADYGIGLEINDSYYGSPNFTKTFYRWGDQRPFVDHNVPTMLFTSGITDNNNTTKDTPDTINWEIFRKRTELIFRFIEKLL